MHIRRNVGATALAVVTVAVSAVGISGVAVAQDEVHYYLPAPFGTELIVDQGNDHPTGRRGTETYAFDFIAADSTEDDFVVLAARGGEVIGQRNAIRNGRCRAPLDGPRPPCWRDVNYVLIDHGDGTSGLYMHMRPGRAVTRGQIVNVGTPLGRAGRTGWTEEVGVQFHVQSTPDQADRGRGGWFLTRSEEFGFSDPDVREIAFDGVPETGDLVVSANPGSTRDPFEFERRPVDLPAVVPFEAGEEREVERAYEPDLADGYGLTFGTDPFASATIAAALAAREPDVVLDSEAEPAEDVPLLPGELFDGTAVRPIFSGELVYAGCGTGSAESLGLTVVVSRELDEGTYYGVHGHLSDVDASLLAADLSFPPSVDANDTIGHYGAIPPLSATLCPAADAEVDSLFVSILFDADVTEEGDISGGTPISPEPLLGRAAYEEFGWFDGPIESRVVDDIPGRPRGNWNRRASEHRSHIPYGSSVDLVARVRDSADILEVRFRGYYPDWARPNSAVRLPGFDPAQTWRILAVCRPPGASGEPARSRGCEWDGDAGDAIVTYAWDPQATETDAGAAWLPRARVAMDRETSQCVPLSLGIEVVDTSGHVRSELAPLPRPARCDARSVGANDGRVVYLDALAPPNPPVYRGELFEGAPFDRGWPLRFFPDPLDGAVIWRDRSNNEDGFRIFVRSSWFDFECDLVHSNWRRVTTVPPNTERYRPLHNQITPTLPNNQHPDVPGNINRWEYAVASYNEAGDSRLVRVGGFVGGGEAFCDPGLEEPGP